MFLDVRLPEDISYGFSGGPQFSTDITSSANGFEYRNTNWSIPLARYSLSYDAISDSQSNTLRAFFYICKGRAYGFRFKDLMDFNSVGQILGVGDNKTYEFQLIKSYYIGDSSYLPDSNTHILKEPFLKVDRAKTNLIIPGAQVSCKNSSVDDFALDEEKVDPDFFKNQYFDGVQCHSKAENQIYFRKITKPVEGSVKIYVNSEHVNANVDFVTGKIRFDVPPGFGTVISADFDFDVPVRFDSDFFNASISHYGTSKLSDLNLVEIRV